MSRKELDRPPVLPSYSFKLESDQADRTTTVRYLSKKDKRFTPGKKLEKGGLV